MSYYRLSSFDEVAKAYNEIKPIRGARANEDIRPIAQRRYWWMRIQKINDNKYVLCDGHWMWSGNSSNDTDVRELTVPITWERKEDGDYITVRNHMNGGASVSRYTFLKDFLPRNMFFHYPEGSGKHYVRTGATDHYLPKFKGKMDWSARTFEMIEDRKLVFKAVNGDWVRVNDLQPMQTRKIDKPVDQHYKPKMKELWDWMGIVLPIMGDKLGDAKGEYASQLTDGKASYWYWERYVEKNLIREILDNPEHDKRMALAGLLAYKVDAVTGGRFDPQKYSYAKFITVLRKTGGMLAVELK